MKLRCSYARPWRLAARDAAAMVVLIRRLPWRTAPGGFFVGLVAGRYINRCRLQFGHSRLWSVAQAPALALPAPGARGGGYAALIGDGDPGAGGPAGDSGREVTGRLLRLSGSLRRMAFAPPSHCVCPAGARLRLRFPADALASQTGDWLRKVNGMMLWLM